MIFNGTAQELADLTRPFWGEAWWPRLSAVDELRFFEESWSYPFEHPMRVEDAAAIIFAAAWSHLIPDRNSSATIEHGACGEFGVIHNGQFVKWCLSPLHAVLAAVSRMGVSNPTR